MCALFLQRYDTTLQSRWKHVDTINFHDGGHSKFSSRIDRISKTLGEANASECFSNASVSRKTSVVQLSVLALIIDEHLDTTISQDDSLFVYSIPFAISRHLLHAAIHTLAPDSLRTIANRADWSSLHPCSSAESGPQGRKNDLNLSHV